MLDLSQRELDILRIALKYYLKCNTSPTVNNKRARAILQKVLLEYEAQCQKLDQLFKEDPQ